MEGQEGIESHKEALTSQGFIVRTEKEDGEFLQSNINTALGNQYQKFDNDLLQITGIEKDKSGETPEKTYQYLKRVVSVVQSNSESLKKDKKQLAEELEVLRTSGGSQEEYEKKVQELVKKHQGQLSEFETKLKEKDQSNFEMLKNSEIDAGIEGFRLNKSDELDEAVISGFIDSARNKVKGITSKRNDEGRLVFYESDGITPMTSKQDGHLLTLNEILGTELSPILKKQITQEGTGGEGQPAGQSGQTAFSNKVEIDQYLSEAGHAVGTQEWIKQRTELVTANKL